MQPSYHLTNSHRPHDPYGPHGAHRTYSSRNSRNSRTNLGGTFTTQNSSFTICSVGRGLDRGVHRVASGPPSESGYDHIAHDSESDKDDAPSTKYLSDYSPLLSYPPTSNDHPSCRHPCTQGQKHKQEQQLSMVGGVRMSMPPNLI